MNDIRIGLCSAGADKVGYVSKLIEAVLGVILLLFGILKNERVKARMFYRMPGGKAIISTLGIFTVILAMLIIK